MTQDPQQPTRQPAETTTVAVIGAGLSGLTAARDLHRRGVEVLVVEAADRCGGRSLSETTPLGTRIDLGGQWIGHDHHRLKSLAAQLGLTEYRMYTSGPLPRVLDGSRQVRSASPTMALTALALGGADLLARSGRTRQWNSATIASWLRRIPGRTARRLLEVIALTSWTADLDRLSIHAMANMIRRQGGLTTMLGAGTGAQESLLVEGAGSIAEILAAELGSRVRLGCRVTTIARGDGGVTVQTSRGVIRAEKVIVTVPWPLVGQIIFEPALPPDRVALTRNTYMGSVYKAIAVYERPFWRQKGGGEFMVLDGPARTVFDSSPPDGPGHLCFLIGGPEAHSLDHLNATGRRDALLADLSRHLGPEVLTPASWHEKSWHLDENAGGGYIALPLPGTTEGLVPAASTPLGDIHWAGTESADDHPGYLEGAIQTGIRAAAEVFEALPQR